MPAKVQMSSEMPILSVPLKIVVGRIKIPDPEEGWIISLGQGFTDRFKTSSTYQLYD